MAVGSPPSSARASRMAARSTTPGTPVKSCMSTRSGVKAISVVDGDPSLLASGPAGHGLDVGGVDLASVLVAEEVLEEDLHRIGQPGDVEAAGEGVESVHLKFRSPTASVARVEKLSSGGGGSGHGAHSAPREWSSASRGLRTALRLACSVSEARPWE